MLLLSLPRNHSTPLFSMLLCQIPMVRCTLNVWDITPHSIDDLFVNWSKAGGNIHNLLLLTAASALCWTIWITRNEVVFDKCRPKTFLQVLFRGTHWLRQWARLQRHDDLRDQLTLAGQHLETSALHFFSSNGWLSSRFIGL